MRGCRNLQLPGVSDRQSLPAMILEESGRKEFCQSSRTCFIELELLNITSYAILADGLCDGGASGQQRREEDAGGDPRRKEHG
jgi:hypothetical protein